MPSILINGCEKDQVSVLDRGFQYGDGLFETIRVVAGVPQYWHEHMERLSEGCRRLNIPLPEMSVFETETESLCKGLGDGVLKITVTRGPGERGYAITGPVNTTRVLATFPVSPYSENYWTSGVVVRVCETRLGENPVLAGIKHLNRLEQVLARAEWSDVKIQEGLMLDMNNNIIEGTMSNIFSVKNNELYTPELSRCGVKGVMREQVMKVANEAGITVNETKLDLDTLYQAEELFLCNSLIGIWPVRQLESHVFNVGPISHQLGDILRCTKSEAENAA